METVQCHGRDATAVRDAAKLLLRLAKRHAAYGRLLVCRHVWPVWFSLESTE